MTALLMMILFLVPAFADSVLLTADQMEGSWPKGLGRAVIGKIGRKADGTALTKTITLEGGKYQVHIRALTSLTQRGSYRITIGDRQLITPAQGKSLRIGWIRAGTVEAPRGMIAIRIEDAEPGGGGVLDAIALASDPLGDRAGRALAFDEYMRDEVARMTAPLAPPASAAEARQRQQAMRERLLRAIGLDTLPPRTPLHPISAGKIDRGDYVIEKIAFESRPRHLVPGLLYLPKNGKWPVPAIINLIGHWNAGKSSDVPQLRAIGLAKCGYAVLSIDPCYAWERAIPGNSEGWDPYVSGAAINGHMAWDVMRAVDYLETRKEVDPERIGATGASGGGQQTLYAGAVDERIKAVAPAVYVWSFRDFAHWQHSYDNWLPGALQNGDMAATLALIAPRALLVLSVTRDYGSLEGSRRQVEQASAFYKALAAEGKISQFVTEAGHDYNQPMREAMYGFMDRWLKGTGDGAPQPEPRLDPFPENATELLVFKSGKIPAEGAATVRSIWTDRAVKLRSELPRDDPAIPRILREEVLRLPVPHKPAVREVKGGLLITTEPGIEIPAVLLGSGPRAVVWISERDVTAEVATEAVRALAGKATVLVVEPRLMSMRADRELEHQSAVLMGRPLIGMWTYDVLRAVDYLRGQRGVKSVSIAASGVHPGLVALVAAVLDPHIERAAIDGLFPSFVSIIGTDWIAEVPGILRVADIEQLVGAAGADRVALNNLQPGPVPVNLHAQRRPLINFLLAWLAESGKNNEVSQKVNS